MFEKIMNALIDRGYNEDSASRIAELIVDYGWSEIRDILNNLNEDDNI